MSRGAMRTGLSWGSRRRLASSSIVGSSKMVSRAGSARFCSAVQPAVGISAPGRIRTFDIWLRRPALFPAELPGPHDDIIPRRSTKLGRNTGRNRIGQIASTSVHSCRCEKSMIAGKAHSNGQARYGQRTPSKQRAAGSNPAGGIDRIFSRFVCSRGMTSRGRRMDFALAFIASASLAGIVLAGRAR